MFVNRLKKLEAVPKIFLIHFLISFDQFQNAQCTQLILNNCKSKHIINKNIRLYK